MEDGIENYKSMLISDAKEYNYVYIFIPVNNSNWDNCRIILNKNKAIEYSERNNCRVEIFIESDNNIYIGTKNYYKNGIIF